LRSQGFPQLLFPVAQDGVNPRGVSADRLFEGSLGKLHWKRQTAIMKTGSVKKKKLALQWKEDKRFNIAVRLQSAGESRAVQSPTNVLVLSEAKASFARVLSVAAAA
jgi:hypothetical protein